MRNSTSDFTAYVSGMIALGWDRYWITHNEPALREAFARNPVPFPPPPPPAKPARDRYAEL